MSMSDPLGDMLTRIRNGQQAAMRSILCPWSKNREAVCKVLKDEGYVRSFKTEEAGAGKKNLIIDLKYDEGRGVIRQIRRVSKPGRRVYSKVGDLPRSYNGLGIYIVSTPHGVLADHQARAENVGGEVLCQVF